MSSLVGKTVLLTRAAEDNGVWAERLVQAGAKAVALPCIATEVIHNTCTSASMAAALAAADWLVFTSRRGVEAFASTCAADLPAPLRVAAVGAATAAAARRTFGRADLTSEAGTAASLACMLAERVAPGAEVVIAVAENAGDVLQRKLVAAGAACTRIDVYRTVPLPSPAQKRALSSLGADNVWLASPSAVAGFANQVDVDTDAAIYTIGPTTTAAARAAGLRVEAQARTSSFDGFMEAMTCPS